jgi:hypothetical protein
MPHTLYVLRTRPTTSRRGVTSANAGCVCRKHRPAPGSRSPTRQHCADIRRRHLHVIGDGLETRDAKASATRIVFDADRWRQGSAMVGTAFVNAGDMINVRPRITRADGP